MRIRNFADRYTRGGRASVGACPSRRKIRNDIEFIST